MADPRPRRLQLTGLPLGPLRRRSVRVTALLSLLLGLAVGIASLLLQQHFVSQYQAGATISGWQNFLRLGAPWEALAPVVVAGLLALIGGLRLGRTTPEPPLHLGRGEARTAGELRAAMRTERRAVRIAYLGMTGLLGMVLVRLLVYAVATLLGSHTARTTLPGVALELGVWLLAWATVWNWHRLYRQQMEAWGVLID